MEAACIDCSSVFTKRGNNHKRCDPCIELNRVSYNKELHMSSYVRKGYTKKGEDHHNYKTGIGIYKKTRKESCELCSSTRHLCVHHKDEIRTNNKPDNLMTLCRSCHVAVHAAARDASGKFIKE